MPERRRLWPLLAYGALGVIALTRHGDAQRVHGARPKGPIVRPEPRASATDSHTREHGRGRHAKAPWEIPWRGWKEIIGRTYAGINDNRLMSVAAGVVFSAKSSSTSLDKQRARCGIASHRFVGSPQQEFLFPKKSLERRRKH